MSNVIVIGGGAAGMLAAIAAAECGHRVTLLEQNEKLGKKIYITGKGRCNVTNACEMDKLFDNVVTNQKFLFSAFYGFNNRQMMTLLEDAGCPLKIERGERVFPVSDHSSDVIAALERLLKQKKVTVMLCTKVKGLWIEAEETVEVEETVEAEKKPKVQGVYLTGGEKMRSDAVILATGGLSYPTTGAGGDGYHMAVDAGHKIKECTPALVPFNMEEEWCGNLQGLSLKNVTLTMMCGKKQIYQGFGEMLFTHFGISGPLALSASSFYSRCKDKSQVHVSIDLKPALSEEQLDRRILRDFEQNLNKQFKNVVGSLYPAKLIPVMIELSGIDGNKKIHEITKEERKRLLDATKHLTMRVSGLRDFHEAVITQGGICVKEINPSTMESKLVSGLYFAGEIMDLDALTGGFNLQIAWSTGHLAGSSID